MIQFLVAAPCSGSGKTTLTCALLAARLCISAIALETLSAAVAALTAHGLQAEVCQISVSRAKAAGKLHLLMANNPIFLITRADEAEKSV